MISTAKTINPLIKEMRSAIKNESKFLQFNNLCLKLHDLAYDDYFVIPSNYQLHMIMPTPNDVTIAWNYWHITRIEDIVVSRLIYHRDELFENWQQKLNTPYRDTGNAMTDNEILELSSQLDFNQLMAYRCEVGKQTKTLLNDLKFSDLSQKVRKADIDILVTKGSVSNHPDAIWLLDFWGKKDVSGLLLMPILRHPFVHLFDNRKLFDKIKKMPKHLVNVE